MRLTMIAMVTAVIALSIGSEACAARGARNKTRVAALGVANAAVSLSQAESNLHQSKLLTDQQHQALDGPITRSLSAAKAFERAAKQWPDNLKTLPADVDAARLAVLAALSDVEKAIPAAANIHDTIVGALEAIRVALKAAFPNVTQARMIASSPQQAQIPTLPMDPAEIVAFLNIVGALVQAGKTTYEKIRDGLRSLLKREGATDEELDAADAALTAEIERREAAAAAAAPAADSSGSQG